MGHVVTVVVVGAAKVAQRSTLPLPGVGLLSRVNCVNCLVDLLLTSWCELIMERLLGRIL
jgi:hypothetical protein